MTGHRPGREHDGAAARPHVAHRSSATACLPGHGCGRPLRAPPPACWRSSASPSRGRCGRTAWSTVTSPTRGSTGCSDGSGSRRAPRAAGQGGKSSARGVGRVRARAPRDFRSRAPQTPVRGPGAGPGPPRHSRPWACVGGVRWSAGTALCSVRRGGPPPRSPDRSAVDAGAVRRGRRCGPPR